MGSIVNMLDANLVETSVVLMYLCLYLIHSSVNLITELVLARHKIVDFFEINEHSKTPLIIQYLRVMKHRHKLRLER